MKNMSYLILAGILFALPNKTFFNTLDDINSDGKMENFDNQYFHYESARLVCTLHLIISVIGFFVGYYIPSNDLVEISLYLFCGGYFIIGLLGIIHGGHWHSTVTDTKVSWGYPASFYGKSQSLILNNISEIHRKYSVVQWTSYNYYLIKDRSGKKYHISPRCFGNFDKFILKIKGKNDISVFFNGKKYITRRSS